MYNFKRKLNRKVDRAEHKRARLENISSILHKSFVNLSEDSSDDDSRSGDNTTQETEMQEECIAAASSNLSVLSTQDNNEYQNADRSENVNNNSYYNNCNESNHSSDDVDVNNSDGDYASNSNDDSDDSRSSTTSANSNQDPIHDQIELNFENDEEKETYLIEVLRIWALESGLLSMRKLDSLLIKLKPLFPNIPLSYKTLLDTPSNIEIIEINGGQLWYKSITTNLNSMNLENYLKIHKRIVIDVNADGLPLFKSSREHFWPLLGRLVGTNNQPFVILLTLFQSAVVPKLDQFLHHFVEEVHYLQENGYTYSGQRFEFDINNFICDAPARSLLKGIVEHGAYFACEKCTVEGEWTDNRMTYPNLNEHLRTDESFINRDQPNHHNNQSPLEELGIGMVSQFPSDAMHLAFLGVFRRLLLALQKWNGPWKLRARIVAQISEQLLIGKATCPRDFNRKPRNFNELKYYKATEFRRLLLYDGIVALKDHLNENIYKHFLLLHCAIYILSSPSLVKTFCHYAEQFINTFISHSVEIYGQKFVVYNVHTLSHLPKECYLHGHLESFSAFVFENKLKSLKASLKSGYKPLQQAAFRDLESSVNIDIIMDRTDNQVALSMRHFYANEVLNGQQYQRITINNVVLQLNGKDSCVQMNNGDIITIVNIVEREDQAFLIGYAFLRVEDFYQYPISSSVLGIFKVSHKDEQRRIFPFVVFKFLHTDGDDDDTLYDVGLSKWVKCCDEDMNGIIQWPSKTVNAGYLARKDKRSEKDWKEFPIHIKGRYDTYLKASQACRKFVKDSNYETEAELGRGLRKKRKTAKISSQSDESDSESDDGKKNKRTMKHKLEEKIPPPPQVLLSGCRLRSPSKDSQNSPKYVISEQFRKKTQDNIVFQENRKKNSSASYACKSTCEQNETSIETASDAGISDKNSELLWKLEQVKSLKKQTSDKKKTILDKNNRLSYYKDGESQRECFESNKKQNKSALPDVAPSSYQDLQGKENRNRFSYNKDGESQTECFESNKKQNESALPYVAPHSSSYQDLQGKKKKMVHKVTLQSKRGFPKESSSTMTNKLSSINTSYNITPVNQNTMEDSSSSTDTIVCPDSPDTMFSKSSASLERYDVPEREDSHHSSLTFKCTGTSTKTSIVDSSAQERFFCTELASIKKAVIENNKEIKRVSSKLDISIMNQENLCRFVIPGEKVIKRPSQMPPLPINTFKDLDRMEKFLANDSNLTGACSYLSKNLDKKSVEKSVRRILAKLVTNTLASKFSLHGHGNKKRFDALKLWDVVQGALLIRFDVSDISVVEKIASTWLTISSWRKQEDGSFGKRTKGHVSESVRGTKSST